MPDPSALPMEFRILRAMKQVLTRIVKETATPPGLRHPLSEDCIEDIRQALLLISAREQELNEAAGTPSLARPRYIDEPGPGEPAVIPVDQIKRKSRDH